MNCCDYSMDCCENDRKIAYHLFLIKQSDSITDFILVPNNKHKVSFKTFDKKQATFLRV